MERILLLKVCDANVDAVFKEKKYYSCGKPSAPYVVGAYIIGEADVLGVPILGFYKKHKITEMKQGQLPHSAFNANGSNWKYEWELEGLTELAVKNEAGIRIGLYCNAENVIMEKNMGNVHVLGYIDKDKVDPEILVKTNIITPFNDVYEVGDIIPKVKVKVGAGKWECLDGQVIKVDDKMEFGVITGQNVTLMFPSGEKKVFSASVLRENSK